MLYDGPIDDECGQGIKNCNRMAPNMVFISKMCPTPDYSRFYAFGRVFSGEIFTGQRVRIMGPSYTPESKNDMSLTIIQRTVLIVNGKIEPVPTVPCGNIVLLVGVDKYLGRQGTITEGEHKHSIRPLKFSVSPVVKIGVSPKNPEDLQKLLLGARKL